MPESTRAWVEARMGWLVHEFGMETLRGCRAVEPTPAFFPDRFDRSEHAVEQMLARVCSLMSVDPSHVALQLFSENRDAALAPGMLIDNEGSYAVGTYHAAEKHVIRIEVSNIGDPMALVATLAHELGHVRLLGEKRVSGEEEDHERLTDLATVFFGFGVFSANACVRDRQWTKGSWSGWSVAKSGYLDEPAWSYALGVWASWRGEAAPRWVRHLRPTPRALTKKALRYLAAHPALPAEPEPGGFASSSLV